MVRDGGWLYIGVQGLSGGGRASGSVCRNEEIDGTLKVCERAPYGKR